MLKVLVSMPETETRESFIPPDVVAQLNKLFDVEWNQTTEQLVPEELREKIKGKDAVISGWGNEMFDSYVLEGADRLKIIAHTGGSVGYIVNEAAYDKGIKVISGNAIYAESVAEGCIAYILASLRDIPHYNSEVHDGGWHGERFFNEGLLYQSVGLVSFGAVAKYLAKMLKAFKADVKVYSRNLSDEDKAEYGVKKASLEEIFSTCKIISLHTALMLETHHMVGEELLEMIQDGAILINTARGEIVDEAALEAELAKKRFKAVLDVFETEPLPHNSKLRGMDNVILIPHMCGPTLDMRQVVTKQLIKDILAFTQGEPMENEISRKYALSMTR